MHQLRRRVYRDSWRVWDKYYTKEDVVRRCLGVLEGLLYDYDLVVEPSAGDGAFLREIRHGNKVGLDVAPEGEGILRGDFLEYEIDEGYERVLVVGNPPYGRYHRLSGAFIRHAVSFGNVQTVGFILPNVYRKATRQRVLPLGWRIVSVTDLGRDCFLLNGLECHVPTSFFVFDRSVGEDLRARVFGDFETGDFCFGSQDDFDVFVFGASPRRVIRDPSVNNRGHYLKAKIPVEELVRRLEGVDWRGNSCAAGGVYWLTRGELLEQYVGCYGGVGG